MLQQSTFDFLVRLKDNNNKEWFAENKKTYALAKDNYYQLANEILTECQKFDESLSDLTHKDCVFRINRDIRFSADKSPYKTNIGIVLSPGGKKAASASYYLHIEPGASFIGGGLWMPPSDILLKVRKEISWFYDELKAIISHSDLTQYYSSFDSNMAHKLTRAPKGFSEDDPAIDLLKLKSFVFTAPIPDKIILTDDFINVAVEHFKSIRPALDFINRAIQSDENGGI